MEKISNYDIVKEMGKKTGKNLIKGAFYTIEYLYASPTLWRKEIEKETKEWDLAEKIPGAIANIVLSSFANGTIFMYAGSAGPNSPCYLNFAKGFAVGFTTNLISALYESFRKTKNQMQEKLESREERNSVKGLENTLNVNQ